MPAAAVIPAPIAYIKVVAIKKLVVGSQAWACGPSRDGHCAKLGRARLFAGSRSSLGVPSSVYLRSLRPWCSSLSVMGGRNVYFEEIRVFKAGSSA